MGRILSNSDACRGWKFAYFMLNFQIFVILMGCESPIFAEFQQFWYTGGSWISPPPPKKKREKRRDMKWYTVDSHYNKLLGPSEITLLYKKKIKEILNFGTRKLLCYTCTCIRILLPLGCIKIQRNFELWDQENYFVISVFFITRVKWVLQWNKRGRI